MPHTSLNFIICKGRNAFSARSFQSTYYFIIIGCNKADLTDQSGTLNPERCADRGFVNSSSISDGLVCYNGTAAGSRAVYVCNDGFILMGNEIRVCQSNGNWNGSIPWCISEEPGMYFLHAPSTSESTYCVTVIRYSGYRFVYQLCVLLDKFMVICIFS